jgi:hypothetical protein
MQLGSGQLALFNLLKAYSLMDSDVGYCQGLSFVAGILLMHVCMSVVSHAQAGASVAEWLRSLTLNHLPLTAVGWNPYRDFGFFHVRKLSS